MATINEFSTPDLNDCPFCGGDGQLQMCRLGEIDHYRVGCMQECPIAPQTGWNENVHEAVRIWNERRMDESAS